jgi:hypothetical protein
MKKKMKKKMMMMMMKTCPIWAQAQIGEQVQEMSRMGIVN